MKLWRRMLRGLRERIKVLACLMGVVMVAACSSQTCVVVSSTTGIGIDATWDPQTAVPKGRVGYIRNELAIVPTNKVPDDAYAKDAKDAKQAGTGGAGDTTDVLLEFNFANFFSVWRDNGVYQRMAVGKNAVKVAPFMFIRDNNGQVTLSKEAIANIKAVRDFNDVLATPTPSQAADTTFMNPAGK